MVTYKHNYTVVIYEELTTGLRDGQPTLEQGGRRPLSLELCRIPAYLLH